jgi:exopolyphosphatase/guanosine-5'-triphosphate,3'-diphosphate pyrophosphatase
MAIPKEDREAVLKLSIILRLAEALDSEHSQRISGMQVKVNGVSVKFTLRGCGDFLLERWSLSNRAADFQEVFGKQLVVVEA